MEKKKKENKKLSNNMIKLHAGMIIPSYKAMCELLEEPIQTSDSKASQLLEWARYFKFHKNKNTFIIDEVYDKPLPPAFRTDDVYSKWMQVLLCDYLVKHQQNYVTMSKIHWYSVCGMVNQCYTNKESRAIMLDNYRNKNGLSESAAFYQMNAFDKRVNCRIKSIFFKSLSRLKKRGYIVFNNVYTIVESDNFGNDISREATKDEVSIILKAQNDIKEELGIKQLDNYNIQRYYDRLNEYYKEKFGWERCWLGLCIIIAKGYAKKAYEESLNLLADEINKNKLCVNQEVVKMFQKAINTEYAKNQSEISEYKTEIEKWGEQKNLAKEIKAISPKGKNQKVLDENYIDLQHQLVKSFIELTEHEPVTVENIDDDIDLF
jgi:hypothetical protein